VRWSLKCGEEKRKRGKAGAEDATSGGKLKNKLGCQAFACWDLKAPSPRTSVVHTAILGIHEVKYRHKV
jgi:hypothetical protein